MAGDMARERVLHAVLERQVKKYGNRTFLHYKDQEFGFKDLNDAANRVASGLQKLGIAKGDKVAIVMDNCPEFLFLLLGLSKLGAIQVPINTAHRGDILTYMLDNSDSRLLVMQGHYADRVELILPGAPKIETVVVLGEGAGGQDAGASFQGRTIRPGMRLGKRVVDWAELIDNDGGYRPADVLWSDPFAIMYTSGTTGQSKGPLTPHNFALTVAERVSEVQGLSEADCVYNFLPYFHNAAQLLCTYPALLSGARMVMAERFSAGNFWSDVRRRSCTTFVYVGSVPSILSKAEPRPDDADNPLRLALGGAMPRDIFEPFQQRFGLKIVEVYGMSEIGLPITGDLRSQTAGSCGRLNPQYTVKIVDDDGLEVGPNTPGELLVRPLKPYIMSLEYYGMPEKTIEVWRDLWSRIGDCLLYDDEGNFYFADRKKDAMRRRGENISSYEVERGINSHPAVLESAAVAVKSDLGEDEVMACVTLKPGECLDPLDLIKHCEQQMAYFMVPRYLRFMEELPKTGTMRVQKQWLRDEGVTPDTWDLEKAGYKLRR